MTLSLEVGDARVSSSRIPRTCGATASSHNSAARSAASAATVDNSGDEGREGGGLGKERTAHPLRTRCHNHGIHVVLPTFPSQLLQTSPPDRALTPPLPPPFCRAQFGTLDPPHHPNRRLLRALRACQELKPPSIEPAANQFSITLSRRALGSFVSRFVDWRIK